MNYRRVLYVDKLTEELKSKLRITSYDKRRSLKGNVYFVYFASLADMKTADRVSKRLRNVTLKPMQPCSTETRCERRAGTCSSQEIVSSILSSIPLPLPSVACPSPPTVFDLSHTNHSTFMTAQGCLSRLPNETLEERVMRVFGPRMAVNESVGPIPKLPSGFISSNADKNQTRSHEIRNEKDKEQLLSNVKLCLNATETARQAAIKLCQLHKRGINYCDALNHLVKVHSTAFYLKATTATQIKVAVSSGLRFPWSVVGSKINILKAHIRDEQSSILQLKSAREISSKIDSETSIAMSSKLAYQLSKLSH